MADSSGFSQSGMASKLDVLAEPLRLTIKTEWREGVAGHFAAIMRAAQEMEDLPLSDAAEPAWRFEV